MPSNTRYRLTDDEYAIIADYRADRIKRDRLPGQQAGGRTRGQQVKEAHEADAEPKVRRPKKQTGYVPVPPKLSKERRSAYGKMAAEKRAAAESRIKGMEAIVAEIERRGFGQHVATEPSIDMIDGMLRNDDICEVTSTVTGIISDMHWPFHDLKRLANGQFAGSYITALEHLKEVGVKTVVINGDAMDCFQLSRHEKLEKMRDFAWELDVARSMLHNIREYFGDKVRIIYREGNHEERFAKYIADKADALKGVVSLPELLRLSSLNIEWVGEKRKLSIGKLWVDHGHEWFGSGGVNPARAYRMKANDNILLGHVHRTTFDMMKRPLDGSFFAGWTMGCLCDLNPYYAPRNAWNHGVCTVTLDASGEFTLNNRIILNNKVR